MNRMRLGACIPLAWGAAGVLVALGDLLLAEARGVLSLSAEAWTRAVLWGGGLLAAIAVGIGVVSLGLGRLLGGTRTGPVARGALRALPLAVLLYSAVEFYSCGELLAWLDWEASGPALRLPERWGGEGIALAAALGVLALGALRGRWPRRPLRRLRPSPLAAGGGALALLVILQAGDGGNSERPGRRNLLLVTIDTLRADHVGAYGARGGTTPTLDRLAREGTVFLRATSPIPLTGPSHATLMTSLYPRSHGFLYNGYGLPAGPATLAETLRRAGYATGAVTHAFAVDSRFGLNRGFQTYVDGYAEKVFTLHLLDRAGWIGRVHHYSPIRGDHVNELALPWVARRAGEPFFLWVHYYDPHEPYQPPAAYASLLEGGYRGPITGASAQIRQINAGRLPLAAEDVARLRALYREEVRYVDAVLGRLLEGLQRLGVLDRTLVVVTADHGEELCDNLPYLGHAEVLYPTVTEVPLIFRAPGLVPAGRRLDDPAPSVDILPTLCDLLEVEPPAGIAGRSLVPRWRGVPPGPIGPPAFSELYDPRGHLIYLAATGRSHQALFRLADGSWSISRRGSGGEEDGGEVAGLEGALLAFNDRVRRVPTRHFEELGEDVKEKLRALGYIR